MSNQDNPEQDIENWKPSGLEGPGWTDRHSVRSFDSGPYRLVPPQPLTPKDLKLSPYRMRKFREDIARIFNVPIEVMYGPPVNEPIILPRRVLFYRRIKARKWILQEWLAIRIFKFLTKVHPSEW